MMVLGLTGGTGCGKSTAAAHLQKKGARIIDADAISRALMQPGSSALAEVAAHFEGVLKGDGSLDRKKLASLVFHDEYLLTKLNSITHKYIIQEIEAALLETTGPLTVIDAPLLFEAGLDRLCDVTLCILADHDTRVKRIMSRDGLTEEEADARIQAQKNDDYYKSRCHYTLCNNHDPEAMLEALDAILKEIFCEA